MPFPTVWIDADAAPRACKEILFRAAERRGLPLVLVANRPQVLPVWARARQVVVGRELDAADAEIARSVQPGDLVITDDVPLAALVVAAGGQVLRPRGEVLDQHNVQQRLAARDQLEEMRHAGLAGGGPPPYGEADKRRFANALDRWLHLARRPA
jgi:hypothetical protein